VRVDTTHRKEDRSLTTNDFIVSANYLVKSFSELSSVESLVLCGSLAKGDLVPGWSDIDFIVFCHDAAITLDFMEKASEILLDPTCKRIGIGIDFCETADFRKRMKIGGRPYMMTFEVAQYGQRKWGPDPWVGMEYGDRQRGLVEMERPLLSEPPWVCRRL
jgi:predicted nucleotidyltransferase